MSQPIIVVYDGEVFRPETPVEIKPNTRFIATPIPKPTTEQEVSEEERAKQIEEQYRVIESLIGSVEGPPDWSVWHDQYIHGTPKHSKQDKKENDQEK